MASVGMVIKDNVSPAIQKKLERLKLQAPAWSRIALRMHRSILINFREGGRPNKWPVSQRAATQGRTPESFGQTLVDTGLLRASIGWKIGEDSATIGMENTGERLKGTQYESVKRGALAGTQVKYGRKHQEGIGVKKRPFILIQGDDEIAIMKILEKHLET